MEKVNYVVKDLVGSVDRRYLIKSYIIGIAVTILAIGGGASGVTFILVIISGILFPFSALVWDEFIDLMMGGYFIVLPLPIMLMWKLVKILLLFGFAIFIAPLGILYILLRNKMNQ